jgi:hypothetical protein
MLEDQGVTAEATPVVDSAPPVTEEMEPVTSPLPVRAAVFKSVRDAARAVQGLLDAGFRMEHISVVCSDRAKAIHFKEYEHDRPAGTTTAADAGAGAAIGSIAAGLAAVTLVVATGGISLLVVGPLFAGTGALVGTFIGAMVSRGVEHEVADYYDQALTAGDLLVAAEIEAGEDLAKLERAERAFEAAGARPIALPQG